MSRLAATLNPEESCSSRSRQPQHIHRGLEDQGAAPKATYLWTAATPERSTFAVSGARQRQQGPQNLARALWLRQRLGSLLEQKSLSWCLFWGLKALIHSTIPTACTGKTPPLCLA